MHLGATYILIIKYLMIRFVTIALVVTVAMSLHTPLHYQTTATPIYLNNLISLQTNLINSMSLALVDYQSVTTNIQASGAITPLQINSTLAYLAAQRLALNSLSSYINTQANAPPCNSTVVAINSRNTLKNQATVLKNAIMAFRVALVNCPNCVITAQLNQIILEQQNYIQVINQICSSNCTVAPPPLAPQKPSGLVDISLNQRKNNLQAKNWVYGNITATQYKYQMFALSIKYNLTSCPITKPYVNPITLLCFNCPTGMTYSLGQRTCITCANNFTFNLVTLQCQSPCNISQNYNFTTHKCQPIPPQITSSLCPLNAPVWNSTTLSCQICPSTTPLFNVTSSLCQPCPTNSSWDAILNQCVHVCPKGQFYDPTTGSCQVVPVCSKGTVFNNVTKRCEVICPPGTVFSNITRICESLIAHNCTTVKPIWNTTTLSCQLCPQHIPVWNKTTKACQPCPPQNPVFNYTSFTCGPVICGHGYQWNTILLRCAALNATCPLKEQGYVFLLGKCVTMCSYNHTYYPQNNTCSCFPQQPLYNSTTRLCQAPPCPLTTKWNPLVYRCVPLNGVCPSWQLYNFTAGGCASVCPVGISFIPASGACNCTPQYPIFNSTNRSCLAPTCWKGSQWNSFLMKCSPLNGNCSAWQQYNITVQFCFTRCPNHQPFIASNNSCKCPPQTPIFNYTDRFCQAPVCPLGYLWNPFLLKCVTVNVSCKSWQTYNFTLGKCVVMCMVNQTYFKKYHNCSCPPQLPVYNISIKNCSIPLCSNGTKWNTHLLNCTALNKTCLSWQQYNFSLGACVNLCMVNQTWFPNNKTCSCPPQSPLYNTTIKNCSIPPCPNATKWNPQLLNCTLLNKTCLPWQQYIFIKGQCINMCQVNHTYNHSTGACSCPPAFPVFDFIIRKCVQPPCPNGTLWNRYLHKCQIANKNCSSWQHYNFTSNLCQNMCPLNTTYVSRTNNCLCPPSAPLFDNITRQCLTPNCSKGYKYNTYLLKCSSLKGNCQSWQLYNFTNQTCLSKCQVNHTYYPSNNTCSCTPAFPLYNTTTRNCTGLPCPSGQLWNAYLKSCGFIKIGCHSWQKFNFTLQACENMCPFNHTYFPSNNSCSCTPSAPMFDPLTRTCVIPNCTNHTKWDKVLKRCVSIAGNCSSWQLYNFTTANCITKCPVGQAYHPSSKTCQCPPQFPVWQNATNSCVVPVCPLGSLYNMFLLKCSPINGNCSAWQYYDFTTQNCITRCQVGHQYYKTNDTCQCYPSHPYFNTTTRLCAIPPCPHGTRWNSNLLKCQSLRGHCHSWQLYNFTGGVCMNLCGVNQTYYLNNDTCSCYPAQPIFNINTRQCQAPLCPYGMLWSPLFLQCRCHPGYRFNATTLHCEPSCTAGHQLNFTSNICQPICGPHMLVNSSNQCQCLNGYVNNTHGFGCRLTCPIGYQYSPVTHKCQIICGLNMFVNSLGQCQCQTGHVVNQNGPGCRSHCPPGTHYNISTLLCRPTCGFFMAINSTNQCQCLSGYVIDVYGLNCRKKCLSGYHYNYVVALCQPVCGVNMFIDRHNVCRCNNGFVPEANGFGCRIGCASGYHYNTTMFRCQPTCGPNMIVNASNVCQCLFGYLPNPNGPGCLSFCLSGFFYNSTLATCQPICASNMIVNSSNLCQCLGGFMLNPNGPGCILINCQPGYIFNPRSQRCQPICGVNMFVNSAMSCQCNPGYTLTPLGIGCYLSCPSGFAYNQNLGTCQKIVPPPICATNMFVNGANQCQCLTGYVAAPNGGSGCIISCSKGFHYNATTLACEANVCPVGFHFNTTTNTCQKTIPVCSSSTFYDSKTNTCVSCPKGYTYNTATFSCDVTISTICPSGYIFNPTTKLCDILHPCPSGYYYSNVSAKCMLQFITSPTAANLITANMTNYTTYYNAQLKANPGLINCASPTPFYDPAVKHCTKCPPAYPYFNLDNSHCQDCGLGGLYNTGSHSCTVAAGQKVVVNPTIGRFLTNVFI